eukprot:TRINITY_DN34577_c0_g1_i1.p1 TRINITY_DN34577_c0_g1~~TRINITY_DN34577_c0_g1_i1.p1  ORF type:complete len:415 (+),score=70.30 TRINITY_DN34577_c0_g1_i1:198-1442(+)
MGNGESLVGVCTAVDDFDDGQWDFKGHAPHTEKNCRDGRVDLFGLSWSVADMQGWRDSMEDANLALPSLGEAVASAASGQSMARAQEWSNVALFGVMDGHGGHQVAKFCEHHLPAAIALRPRSDMPAAMSSAYLRMDEMLQEDAGLKELRRLALQTQGNGRMPRFTAEGVGCTCVLTAVTAQELVTANAGDSRAVLSRRGQACVELSKDHKPSLPSERSRIEQAGGWIEFDGPGGIIPRVNGDLSLSRAIGDLEYKDSSLPAEQHVVTAMPDITRVQRTPQDEFLILACDGVWDVVSSQGAVDFLRKELGPAETWASRLRSGELKGSDALAKLLDHCLSHDLGETEGFGGDNMTAVLVLFVPHAPARVPGVASGPFASQHSASGQFVGGPMTTSHGAFQIPASSAPAAVRAGIR